jgi:hypothetical protein
VACVGANPCKGGGGGIIPAVGRGAAPAVFGFWRPGGVAAPPTKEGRGKGAQNKNKRNRSGRGLIIGVVGEGVEGKCAS